MNIYWVYDLPIWLFGALTIAVTVAIALGGFYATRKWVRRVHRDQHSHNDIVGFYLGAICLFYGITLGLLAVGTWQAYSELDSKVGEEASALATLYRNVSSFPDPKRAELQADLREYTRQVIDVAWPLQRRGIVPQNAAGTLEALQTHLASFEPTTEGQKTRYAETYREFDRIVELRRIRLKSVVAGLPMPLWSVVLVGALVNIAVTWFFDMRSQRLRLLTCRPNVGPVRSIHALPRMDARLAGFLLFGFRFGENYGAIRHPRCWKTGPGKTAARSIYLLFESRHEQKSRVLRGWSWTWTALTGNRLSAFTGDLSSKSYPLSPDVRDDNTGA